MSSKTARRNRRESSQVGATISRLPGPPPPRGKQAGLSPLFQPPGRAKLPKQRLSGRPRTRPHEGRAGSPRPFPASAAAAPPPRARAPAPRPGRGRSRGLLALAAHSPGSCGTPGAQRVQPRTGPSARLGSAPSLRRSFPAHPYLTVPQRCHGRPTTPAQPSPERLRAGQKHAAEGVGPGRSRGGLGGGRGAGPVILSARRRRRSTRDADRGALLPPVALRVLCGPFRRCAPPSPRGCFES